MASFSCRIGGWLGRRSGRCPQGRLALVATIALAMASAVITTSQRLTVRTLTEEDAPFLADLHGRAEVVEPLGMEPSTGVQEERARLDRWADLFGDARDVGVWGAETGDGSLVGLVLLKTLRPQGDHDGYEVGWRLHPDAWGNGYATEAAAAVIDVAFTKRDLDVVYAVVKPTNPKSRAVADRLAMTLVGELVFDGVLHDLLAIVRP